MRPARLEVVWRCLVDEAKLFAGAQAGSQWFERPGIVASIVPAAPDRSMFNWVVPSEPSALATHYDDIARSYDDAGVRAFTVWIDEDDTTNKQLVAARGHKFDGAPRAMYAEIDAMQLADPRDLDCRETDDIELVSWINDLAYGFPPPAFVAAIARITHVERWRTFEARIADKPVCGMLVHDSLDGNLGVCAVATLPEARGQQVASRLLSFALADARARGMRTTSLQASSKGKGVYARLGYQDLGAIEMWEHRRSAGAR